MLRFNKDPKPRYRLQYFLGKTGAAQRAAAAEGYFRSAEGDRQQQQKPASRRCGGGPDTIDWVSWISAQKYVLLRRRFSRLTVRRGWAATCDRPRAECRRRFSGRDAEKTGRTTPG